MSHVAVLSDQGDACLVRMMCGLSFGVLSHCPFLPLRFYFQSDDATATVCKKTY